MKSHYKLIFVLLPLTLLVMLACNKKATTSSEQSSPSLNVLPKNVPYTGYRLELVNVKVKEEKGNVVKVTGTIINTGRNKVVLPSKHVNELVVNIDETLRGAGYPHLSDAIKIQILRQKLNLEPGQMAYNTSFGVKNTSPNPPSIPKEEMVVQKEETTNRTKEEKDQEKVPVQEVEELVEKGESNVGEEACPDLVIESFSVTKRKKKYAEITYVISNKGTAPASLFGENKSVDDNIAVRAYASGNDKLSRGDMILGGSYIEKGLKDKKGMLLPNESYEGTFRVDIRKKTRHMPYLIMFVDTYQGIWECDEGNNVQNISYR